MRKIALVAVNAKYAHTNLALFYLDKALKDRASSPPGGITLVDWNINRSPRELLEILGEGGFSHAVFSAYIWNTRYLQDFLPDLRRLLPDMVIVMGGPEAVYRPDLWLSGEGADYVASGAAEDYAALLPSLEKPARPELMGVQKRPFSETVFPYDRELLESLAGRLVYYEASRGCLFHCTYCLSSREDQTSEYRTLDQIGEELALLVDFNGTVKFVDRTFNANPRISRFIWQFMIDHPPRGCFHFELHPLLLTDEDFNLIQQLPRGTVQFEVGIQTIHEEIRSAIHRNGDWEKEKEAIRRLRRCGSFHLHLDQIVGLPGDSPETAASTMNEILSLNPDDFQLGFLKILPGTPLAAEQEALGIISSRTPPYEILSTPDFSFENLQRFHRLGVLVEVFHNKGFFRQTLPLLAEAASGGYHGVLDGVVTGFSPDLDCRRWDYWAEILLRWTRHTLPDLEREVIDTLRLDWCPLARAHHYPAFLEYPREMDLLQLKKELTPRIKELLPEARVSDINKAILYIPLGTRQPRDRALVFIRIEGTSHRLELPGSALFPSAIDPGDVS